MLRKPIPATDDRTAKHAKLKQINDDFKAIQLLNNKLMSDVSAQKEPDYSHVSAVVSEIGSKARRLKANLALPKVEVKKETRRVISSSSEFNAGLKALDQNLQASLSN